MRRGVGLTLFMVLAFVVFIPASMMAEDLLAPWVATRTISLVKMGAFAVFTTVFNLAWWAMTGRGLVRWPSSTSHSESSSRT